MPTSRPALEQKLADTIREFLAAGGDTDDVETTLDNLREEFVDAE